MNKDKELAYTTIKECLYLNLATICPDGRPWNTPLYFTFDKEKTCYWGSAYNSQHSRNIRCTSDSFITIYPYAEDAIGVYIEAHTYEISEVWEVDKVLEEVDKVRPLSPKNDHNLFLGDSPLRLYKAIAKRMYVSTPKTAEKYKGLWVDHRVEIVL